VSRRDDLLGGAYAVVASVAFGGVTVMGRSLAVAGLDVTSILAVRFGVASVLLFMVLPVARQPLRPPGSEWAKLVGLGVFGYAVEAGFFFAALREGTATAVTLLFFTYPVVVTVGSVILGRGVPGRLVAGSLAAALAGTAIVVGSGGGIDISTAGIVLALTSSVMFSAYFLGAEATLRETPSLTGAAWVAASASLALAATALVTGNAELPETGRQTLTLLAMGAGTAVAFVTLFGALRRLGAVRTSVVMATEPVAASAFAITFLDEPLRALMVVGGVLIVAGAVGASIARGAPEAEVPLAEH
jgi:drug/metabolite transporter (DMT)-like permease